MGGGEEKIHRLALDKGTETTAVGIRLKWGKEKSKIELCFKHGCH